MSSASLAAAALTLAALAVLIFFLFRGGAAAPAAAAAASGFAPAPPAAQPRPRGDDPAAERAARRRSSAPDARPETHAPFRPRGAGIPGEVGVDVPPREAEGGEAPLWRRPPGLRGDFYGPEGPELDDPEGLRSAFVPDHDLLEGELGEADAAAGI